jgi:hypothetical protein
VGRKRRRIEKTRMEGGSKEEWTRKKASAAIESARDERLAWGRRERATKFFLIIIITCPLIYFGGCQAGVEGGDQHPCPLDGA